MREIQVELTDWQRDFALSATPDARTIVTAVYTRDEWLPAPIKLTLEMKNGSTKNVILKSTRRPVPDVNEAANLDGLIAHEWAVLMTLEQSSLPVPKGLAGPALDPEGKPAILISFIEGTDLQTLSCGSDSELLQSKQLVVDAIQQMQQLTGFVKNSDACDLLPKITLSDELDAVEVSAGGWAEEPVFTHAVDVLRGIFLDPGLPLVFSNGDYQPGNFLANDGRLVGFLDFEFSRFEDPLYGIAKYRVYDILPLDRAGMIEFYLDRTGFTQVEFQSRLALRCLWTLKREVPVRASTTGEGLRILRLLESAIAAV